MAPSITAKGQKFVKVYLLGPDEYLAEEIDKLAQLHGLPASKVGALAIRLGLPLVKNQLAGLLAGQKEKGE